SRTARPFPPSLSFDLHLYLARILGSISIISMLLVAGFSASAATIVVPAGGDLQAAINASSCGDEITLQAGATFSGNFLLKYKGPCSGTAADYITIRSSNLAALPPPGTRITPSYASAMAR